MKDIDNIFSKGENIMIEKHKHKWEEGMYVWYCEKGNCDAVKDKTTGKILDMTQQNLGYNKMIKSPRIQQLLKTVPERIISVLGKNKHRGLTSHELCIKVKGCPHASVRGRLSELVKKGTVKQRDGLHWLNTER